MEKDFYIYAIKTENVQLLDVLAAQDKGKLSEEENEWLVQAAIIYGSPEFAEKMMDFTDVEVRTYRDSEGNSLLHFAATTENSEVVKILLGKGLDLEARNFREATPICIAAKENSNLEVLKTLETAGANPYEESYKGDNLLHLAVCNQSLDVVKFVASNFTTRSLNDEGESVLQRAVLYGKTPEVVRYILEKNKREVMVLCQ